MSKPAESANEIEDVLASIRRLVSHSGVTAPQLVTSDKLVLTPEQRVSEPDDPWAPVPPAAPDAQEDGNPAWGLEDRLSDWGKTEGDAEGGTTGHAMAEHESAPEPQAHWPEATVDPFEFDGRETFDSALEPDMAEAFEPETGDADWPDHGVDSALRDLAAARVTRATPDTPGTDVAVPESAPVAEPAAAAPVAAPKGDDAGPEVARVHASTERSEGGLGRDGPTRPVFSRQTSKPQPHKPHATPEEAAPEAQDVEDFDDTPSAFTYPDVEEGILDEETLREIVAEVVHEHLQGTLGQRITRNVRKMVRREIRIALAAKDLE